MSRPRGGARTTAGTIRRQALGMPPKQAILEMRKAMEEWPTNEELLKQVVRSAAS